jgi:hypothetical protein
MPLPENKLIHSFMRKRRIGCTLLMVMSHGEIGKLFVLSKVRTIFSLVQNQK